MNHKQINEALQPSYILDIFAKMGGTLGLRIQMAVVVIMLYWISRSEDLFGPYSGRLREFFQAVLR